MENEPVIYWSRGNIKEKVSHVEGVDVKVWEFDSASQKLKHKPMKPKKHTKSIKQIKENGTKSKPETSPTSHAFTSPKPEASFKQSKSQNVSLKNLCFEDKQRVANLIRELARANEDKTSTETTLNNERKQFNDQLITLREDKAKIEAEQQKLLVQYEECQQLLTHYQNQISEQQKEVANDISKLLNTTPLLKQNKGNSNLKRSTLPTIDNHDITVHELNDNDTQRSMTEGSERNAPFSMGESYLSEIPILHKENMLGDDFNIPIRDREKNGQEFLSHNQSYTIEEYAKSLTSAFESKVKQLSPHSKRLALMDQKKALENEQNHLQQLLQQQEDMLRKRQSELKHRHKMYAEKIRTCDRCENRRNSAHDQSDDFTITRSSGLTNRSITNAASFNRNNPELPEYQPRHAVLYDDVTSSPNSESADIVVRSQISSDIPPHEVTSDRERRPSSTSRRKYDVAPWRSLQLTNRDSTSASRDHASRSTIGHSTEVATSANERSPSVSGNRRFTASTIDPTSMTSSPLKPAYVTSSAVDRISLGSSTLEPESTAQPTRKPTFATSSAIEDGFVTSSLLDRDADLLSSVMSDDVDDVTPRRSLHATMNNITMLSDLVESTDLSNTDHRRFTQSYSTSYRPSEVTGSTTFDPDDSEILEDIFFIR